MPTTTLLPSRFACTAALAAALALSACGTTLPPVIDRQTLLCPPEAVAKPACVEPPPPGTDRPQVEVFANELGCYRRVAAWDSGWQTCLDAARD